MIQSYSSSLEIRICFEPLAVREDSVFREQEHHTVTLNPIILASRKLEELRIGAISGYPGKVKSKPKEVAPIFLSVSKTDENRYDVARKLLVTADERKFDWGETQRTNKPRGKALSGR